MNSTNTQTNLPWQVWVSFGVMLVFAAIHLLLALSGNVPYLYVSVLLENVLAIGLLKLWKWAYWVTIVFSVLNIVMLVVAMLNYPLAVISLLISAAYLILIIKTYMVVFVEIKSQ